MWFYYSFLNCLEFIFCRSFPFLLVSCLEKFLESPISICLKAGLVLLNSLNLCLESFLFLYQIWVSCLVVSSWLQLLPFHHLNIPCHSLLTCRVSVEKSADSLDASSLVICHFPLAAFNILSLSLLFVSLITMCLYVFLLGFILPGTLCFLDMVDYFLSHVREVFSY